MTQPLQPGHIGEREREILTAIVEAYISSGEPVGSRTLSRINREGLSAATIRNVMSDLSEGGYLEQPHTSAGRVPTAQAYRFYVDRISGELRLDEHDRSVIQESLAGVGDVQEFMERTSHVLSLISHNVGVAIAGSGRNEVLEHIYFTRLADQKVLAVVVTRSGVVRDKLLRVRPEITQADLEVASRYLNDNFRGWTMQALRDDIAQRIQQERSEYDRLMNSIAQLYQEGALETAEHSRVVFLEGTANLVAGEQDAERLRHLLRTLEEKERLAELLSAYLDAQQESVRVVIGLGEAAPELSNFVLIGAPARSAGQQLGSVAVIGPTRMDYQHTISAVAHIAAMLDRILSEE